jgi:predicted oxidoreductase
MAAAVEAARAGVRVTVLDEGRRPGGQIYRQLHEGFSVTDPRALGSDQARGRTLLAEFAAATARVDYWPEALVWASTIATWPFGAVRAPTPSAIGS